MVSLWLPVLQVMGCCHGVTLATCSPGDGLLSWGHSGYLFPRGRVVVMVSLRLPVPQVTGCCHGLSPATCSMGDALLSWCHSGYLFPGVTVCCHGVTLATCSQGKALLSWYHYGYLVVQLPTNITFSGTFRKTCQTIVLGFSS